MTTKPYYTFNEKNSIIYVIGDMDDDPETEVSIAEMLNYDTNVKYANSPEDVKSLGRRIVACLNHCSSMDIEDIERK